MRKGFTKIPNELRDLPLSIEAIGLYTWLSLHADQNGQIKTSRADLTKRTGLSQRQIRTAVEKLVATKLATKQTTKLPTKLATTLTITFLETYEPKKITSDQVNDQVSDQVNDQPSRAYKNDNIIISCLYSLRNNKKEKEYNYYVIALERIGENANSMSDKSDAEVQRLVPIFVKEYYNLMVETNKSRMGKIKTNIINQRLAFLWARIKESGLDNVLEVIDKATQSNFLNGGGNRGFVANFEWIMRPNNFPKVLEGTYDNRIINNNGYADRTNSTRTAAEQRAFDVAARIAELAAEDDANERLWQQK